MFKKVRVSPDALSLLLLFGFAGLGLVGLTILAQIVPNSYLLEMIASFLPHLIAIGGLICVLLAFYDRKIAAASAVLLAIAAWPIVSFQKFETASLSPCTPDTCLTVITANILSRDAAMAALNDVAERENADIVALNEAVIFMTPEKYRRVFPRFDTVVHAAWETMPRHMGNPITLLARRPIERQDRVLRRDTGSRAYILMDLADQWQGVRIVAAHAMTPVSEFGLKTRDNLLEAASQAATQSESFILMGDFNLTPWTPAFQKLPGKRAGEPRISRTWPVALGPFGIPIDHIMFSDDLELIETRVLEPIGSDHYPVLARFRRKD